MTQKLSQLNSIFLILLLLIGACAISLSIFDLFVLPALLPNESATAQLMAVPMGLDASIDYPSDIYMPQDSPYVVDMTIDTPAIQDGETINVYHIFVPAFLIGASRFFVSFGQQGWIMKIQVNNNCSA